MEYLKRVILLISGFLVVLSPCKAATKILGQGQNEANNQQNGNSTNSDLTNYFQAAVSRTLGSSQIFDTLQNQIYDAITNITLIASGLGNDIQGTVQNQTNNASCNQMASQLWDAIKIPIFVIVPAIIIGVVVFIKKIGLITAWLPSVTAPFFSSFKSSWNTDSDSDSGSYGGSGGGWSSPGYGSGPSAPSPGYGTPGLSRQTSILEAIENLSNIYGNANANGNGVQTYSQQIPGNLPGNLPADLGNYGNQLHQLQDYQGGQSVQNSETQATNNYPYYYYRDPNLSNLVDYSNSEKTNLDNAPAPAYTGTANQAG